MRILNATPFPFAPLAGRVHAPRPSVTLVVKGSFALEPERPARPLDEQPTFAGDVYRDDDLAQDCLYEGDLAPWKPRADVLLAGTCHAPGARPVRRCRVSFRVGGWSKSLAVTGARTRSGFLFVRWTSAPRPFAELPLVHPHSFGGPKWPWNPVGCGHRGRALPRIEVVREGQRPGRGAEGNGRDPAGFGPVSRLWKSRTAKAGTYQGDWLEKRWPWYPEDFDWGYFNAAPADQQIEGYLAGDEELALENLRPDGPLFRGRLPGLRVRAFLAEREEGGGSRFREVPMRLDTLFVDADRLALVLLWRGVADVRSEELKDLTAAVIAAEPLGDAPHPVARYEKMLEEPAEAEPEPEPAVVAEAEARPAESAGPDVLAAALAEFAKADKAAVEAMQQRGLDPAALAAQARPVSLPDVRAQLEKAAAAEGLPPELRVKLPQELEAILAQVARLQALPLSPPAPEPVEAEPVPWTRERCLAHAAAGGSFAEVDLSGLDLSGVDLGGADLSGVILRGAKLAGATLAGAKLTGAVLAGADLAGAVLRDAILASAEATGALLPGADLAGADLAGAIFAEAGLESAKLAGARAGKAIFERANLAGADLTGARLDEADLSGARLGGASLAGASLAKASLEGAQAAEVVFRGADLTGARVGEGADLSRARLAGVRAAGSIWSGATLDGADFTGAVLGRADFSAASLRGADFSRADLRGASLAQARLAGARLRRVNLFRGSCEQADLTGADCRESNFFEVEFLGAVTKDADFRGANLKRTKLA